MDSRSLYKFIKISAICITVCLAFFVLNYSLNNRSIMSKSDYNNCNIEIEKSVEQKYKSSAKNVYYNFITENEITPDVNNAKLDTILINKILKMIQLIQNTELPEADTILNILEIDSKENYYYDRIDIYGNDEDPFLNKLAKGIIPTGNSELDKIISKYGLELKSSSRFKSSGYITLHTKNEYNMHAVGLELVGLTIIDDFNEKVGWIGVNSSIELIEIDELYMLKFYRGIGDCMAGCIKKRYWEFKMDYCNAEFIGSYGDSILSLQ